MNPFLTQLWTCSWQAAVAAMLVLLARFIFQNRLSPGWRCGLWAIVLLRLLVPTLPTSPLSLFGMTRWQASDTSRNPSTSLETTSHTNTDESMTTRTGFLPPDTDVIPIRGPISSVSGEVSVNGRQPSVNGLGIAWLLGIIVLTLRFAWSNIRFTRRLSDVEPVTDGPIFDLLRSCCDELAIHRPPTLLLTDTVNVPALTGVFRPRILIPSNLSISLTSNQLRLVFLHELCHLKRHDLTIDWICTAINLLHWFNPLLWIAASSYRADRELLRDAAVLRAAGPDSAESYGLTILTMAKRPMLPGYRPMVAAFIQGRGQIHERVQMIATFNASRSRFSVIGLMLVILVGCATLTSPKSSNVVAQGKAGPAATTPSTLPIALEEHSSEKIVASAKVQAALAQRLPEMDFNGVRLSEALGRLRALTGANLSVDWNALADVGVTRDARLTARLKDIGWGKALTTILADVGGGKAQLSYLADGDVIKITTLSEVRRLTASTRFYDIHDLLFEVPDFDPDTNPNGPDQSSGLFAKSSRVPEKTFTRTERVNVIIKIIQETVAPDSWAHGMQITEISGRLAIRQSAEQHRYVEELLSQLRQTRGLQIMVEVKYVLLDRWAIEHFSLRKTATTRPVQIGPHFNDAEIESLLHSPDGQTHAKIVARPRLSVFNGQRGYLFTASRRAYISGYTFDATKNQYLEKIDETTQGLLTDVQATISSDRKFATLTLRPRISRLDRFDEDIWINSPSGHPLKIQHPVNSIRQLHTTISVPDQHTLIIGGFEDSIIGETKPSTPTTLPSKPATQPTAEKGSFLHELMTPAWSGMELFVFVRPTIIINCPPPHERTTQPAE